MNAVHNKFPLLLIWLAVCALLIFVAREQIATGVGWDPDDQLRQVQLRDWLAGQSWFDTTQYRIAAPDSQPMHWPRLIEIPLALIMLLLTPIFGAALAETGAMIIVPLVTLGIAMWLVSKISEAIFDKKVALLAAALTATAVPVIIQLRPMRIDHHGWQIVLALVALWTMFWPDKRKGGIALGLALALWLSISLEGLPLSVAFIALLVWRWMVSLDEGTRLFWSLAGFLGGSVFLYLATQGQFNPALNYCDAISPAHLFACAAGAAIILPAIRLGPSSIWLRVVFLAAAAIAAFIVMYFTAPQCIGGAFGELDPLVRQYWLVNVGEGLPVWVQEWKTSVSLLGGSIFVGLATLGYLWWKRPTDVLQDKLLLIGYAFLWSFIVSLLVQRASAVAAAYALPLMAWAVQQAFVRARLIQSSVVRIFATASVVFLIMPGPLAISLYNNVETKVSGVKAVKTGEDSEGVDSEELCKSPESLARLNALPTSQILAPFNLGPKILVKTPHSVVATSHHRNDSAMASQIRIFTSPPNKARTLLEKYDVRYIVVCPDDPEIQIYADKHPDGLWGKLHAKNKPNWLQPVYLRDSPLLIWRVVPKPLRNDM